MNMMPTARMDVGRSMDIAHLVRSDEFLRKVLDLSIDCVKILDGDGAICFMNDLGVCLLELDDFSVLAGKPWVSTWPESERSKIAEAIAAALLGSTVRLDAFCPTAKGTPKWWDITVAPVDIAETGESVLVAISRDVTDRVHQAEALQRLLQEKDELLEQKDLLMHEVHHRAKNSLQLVQGLLGIQSRAKGIDSVSAAQLMQSSARVRTIAALHDRLYRSRAALEVDVKPYLASLVNDMETSLATSLSGRQIRFDADDAVWMANDVPALGLVLTELMTNAVRHGAGDIAVSFRQPGDEQAILIVEDRGGSLPVEFDPLNSQGLGMKLVTSMLRERSGGQLTYSCQDGVTRFVAYMPRTISSSAVAA